MKVSTSRPTKKKSDGLSTDSHERKVPSWTGTRGGTGLKYPGNRFCRQVFGPNGQTRGLCTREERSGFPLFHIWNSVVINMEQGKSKR